MSVPVACFYRERKKILISFGKCVFCGGVATVPFAGCYGDGAPRDSRWRCVFTFSRLWPVTENTKLSGKRCQRRGALQRSQHVKDHMLWPPLFHCRKVSGVHLLKYTVMEHSSELQFSTLYTSLQCCSILPKNVIPV